MYHLPRRMVYAGFSLALVVAFAVSLLPISPALAQGGSILDEVRGRGVLNCGVNGQVAGFGFLDPESGE